MPDLAMMEAATPKCPDSGQVMGIARPCDLPLQWSEDWAGWRCLAHGMVLSGDEAAAWLAAPGGVAA